LPVRVCARDLRALLHCRVRCACTVFPPYWHPMLPWAFPCEGLRPLRPAVAPPPSAPKRVVVGGQPGSCARLAGFRQRCFGKPKRGVRVSPWPDRLPSDKANPARGPDRASPLPEEVRSWRASREACPGRAEATSGDHAAVGGSRFPVPPTVRCFRPETPALHVSVEPVSLAPAGRLPKRAAGCCRAAVRGGALGACPWGENPAGAGPVPSSGAVASTSSELCRIVGSCLDEPRPVFRWGAVVPASSEAAQRLAWRKRLAERRVRGRWPSRVFARVGRRPYLRAGRNRQPCGCRAYRCGSWDGPGLACRGTRPALPGRPPAGWPEPLEQAGWNGESTPDPSGPAKLREHGRTVHPEVWPCQVGHAGVACSASRVSPPWCPSPTGKPAGVGFTAL
jgi:hypothetical protein